MIGPILPFNRLILLKSKLVRRFGVFLPTGNWIMNRIHIHQGERGYRSEDLAQSEGTCLVYYSIQSSMTLLSITRFLVDERRPNVIDLSEKLMLIWYELFLFELILMDY